MMLSTLLLFTRFRYGHTARIRSLRENTYSGLSTKNFKSLNSRTLAGISWPERRSSMRSKSTAISPNAIAPSLFTTSHPGMSVEKRPVVFVKEMSNHVTLDSIGQHCDKRQPDRICALGQI